MLVVLYCHLSFTKSEANPSPTYLMFLLLLWHLALLHHEQLVVGVVRKVNGRPHSFDPLWSPHYSGIDLKIGNVITQGV